MLFAVVVVVAVVVAGVPLGAIVATVLLANNGEAVVVAMNLD